MMGISHQILFLFDEDVRYVQSFGGVDIGEPALYVNYILNIGLAINQGNFAGHYAVQAGPAQTVEIRK